MPGARTVIRPVIRSSSTCWRSCGIRYGRASTVGGTRIDLQWTDNAYNESGFIVERRINGVYTPIATVAANVTSYSDAGLTSTGNSSYRVKAYNAVGDSIYSTVWVYSGWT